MKFIHINLNAEILEESAYACFVKGQRNVALDMYHRPITDTARAMHIGSVMEVATDRWLNDKGLPTERCLDPELYETADIICNAHSLDVKCRASMSPFRDHYLIFVEASQIECDTDVYVFGWYNEGALTLTLLGWMMPWEIKAFGRHKSKGDMCQDGYPAACDCWSVPIHKLNDMDALVDELRMPTKQDGETKRTEGARA